MEKILSTSSFIFCLYIITMVWPVTTALNDPPSNETKSIFCYYTMWSSFRNDSLAHFLPSHIDPKLCTHLIYSAARPRLVRLKRKFASKSPKSPPRPAVHRRLQLVPFERDLEMPGHGTGFYKQVVALKKVNPELKVILSVTS
jgi:GH18 family chitinase